MRLKKAHITEFQSVRDSNSFEVGDVTCLVGKNEAGKSAILQALYRLNPVIERESHFDVTDDYPRADVEDYRYAVETKQRDAATVVRATFTLEQNEVAAIESEVGRGVLGKPELTLSKGYASPKYTFTLPANEEKGVRHLIDKSGLHQDEKARLAGVNNAAEAVAVLKGAEQTEAVKELLEILQKVVARGLNGYIYDKFLASAVPRFVYFDDYYQMRGVENIESLLNRKGQNQLIPSDHPMLGLIDLARLKLDELLNPARTQELVNKLEGAGNHLSKRVLTYWSQNKHLAMRFDVRPGRKGDPEGMTTGTNIWAGVFDSRHKVTTSMETRSQGFVWFFSFLAWYSSLQREGKPLILLLDEPGLFLHAKAQMDLLRYFDAELGAGHQLIYTTHSPFMVDPARWDRARIVQDKGIDTLDPLPTDQEGTKVLTDVLEASSDSLFPLQAALGFEIHQTLFIGPNNLIVEGVSDLLYLQTMSTVLEQAGRTGLDRRWTITPVGGAEKVPTFVALIGAQRSLNLATLLDIDKATEQTVENLFKRKLLAKQKVSTYAEFTGTKYADVEDMFDADFYLALVNEEYKASLPRSVKVSDLTSKDPRIVRRIAEFFEDRPLKADAKYNHFRPARYFTENTGALRPKMSDATLDRFERAFKKVNDLLPAQGPA